MESTFETNRSMDYAKEHGRYLANNPTWHVEDSVWKADKIEAMISKNNLNPTSIAEIGCGAGEILNQLHTRAIGKKIEFHGFDVSPDAYALAHAREKLGLRFYNSDLLQLDHSFDLLLLIDVMEHVEDYMGFVRKASNKAKYKIFHIPLDISLFSIIENYPISARTNIGHLHYFTKDTALATLLDCGLEIIDFAFTPFAIELYAKQQTAKKRLYNVARRVLSLRSTDFASKIMGGYSLLVLAS